MHRKILAGLMLLVSQGAFAASEANQLLKRRQDCEVTVTKGFVALNRGQNDEARDAFNQALEMWPHCYFAHEGLGHLSEKSGKLKQAIESYLRAKQVSPDERWPHLNFHIGRIYMDLRAEDRAETYLKVAASQGAFPAQVNYLLGYMAYRHQDHFAAEEFFHKALSAAESEHATEADKSLLQSIHFYLGEIYTRAGLPIDAVRELRRTEIGTSPEVRRAGWKMHSSHNRILKEYGFGIFHRYDSNVALLPNGQALPSELSGVSSHGLRLIGDGRIQTSPAKKFSAGAEATLSWNYNLNGDVGRFDELRILPALWGRYWNYGPWQLTGRYDFSRTGYGRFAYSPYEVIHAPGLQFDYFLKHRWTLSGRYQLAVKTYPRETEFTGDLERDAAAHIVTLRASSQQSLHPRIRPAFQYQFTSNGAKGVVFSYTGHSLDASALIRIFRRTEADAGVGYEMRDYGALVGGAGREDRYWRLHSGLKSSLWENFIVSLDLNYTRAASNEAQFEYNRFEAQTGLIFRFY